MGFDLITFAKVNNLLKGGGVGRTATSVITYDGSEVASDVLGMGILGVKMANEPLDLSGIKRLEIRNTGAGTIVDATDNVSVVSESGIDFLATVGDNTIPYVASVPPNNPEELEVGLYFFEYEAASPSNAVYQVALLETETIHPIDPKFIPGAVLPVVELTTVLSDGATFTDQENAKLTAAIGGPAVIKWPGAGADISCAVFSFIIDNGIPAFVANLGSGSVLFADQTNSGIWGCSITT